MTDAQTQRLRAGEHIEARAVRSHYGAGAKLVGQVLNDALAMRDTIREDLIAERVTIESCREAIDWLKDKDSTTRKMLEGASSPSTRSTRRTWHRCSRNSRTETTCRRHLHGLP